MRTALPRRNETGDQQYLESVDILRTPLEDDDYVSSASDETLTATPADTALTIPDGAVAVSILVKGGAARYKLVPTDGDVPLAADLKHYIDVEERMEFRTVGFATLYLKADSADATTAYVSFLG